MDQVAVRQLLLRLRQEIDVALHHLDQTVTQNFNTYTPTPHPVANHPGNYGNEKVVEGIFNGDAFLGRDGQEYAVPPNYASKSKLVTGDVMKLNITPSGAFIYKQTGPKVERDRVVGNLYFDELGKKWSVDANGQNYKVLSASISFHRGQPGDEVAILIPKDQPAEWGAVDNVVHRNTPPQTIATSSPDSSSTDYHDVLDVTL